MCIEYQTYFLGKITKYLKMFSVKKSFSNSVPAICPDGLVGKVSAFHSGAVGAIYSQAPRLAGHEIFSANKYENANNSFHIN